MAFSAMRRQVQRSDDPFGIPACFYWTVDEVADWIESIGYGKYKETFRSHFINGRKLLTVDACTLPKMGIVHFGDILALAQCIKGVLGKNPKISWTPPANAPRFFPSPQSFDQTYRDGNDIDYNWRLWVPEYYYGYSPKQYPVTNADFHARWYHNHDAWQVLRAPPHDVH